MAARCWTVGSSVEAGPGGGGAGGGAALRLIQVRDDMGRTW